MDRVVGSLRVVGVDIMARIQRWWGLRRAGVLAFAVAWALPVEVPLISTGLGPARTAVAQDFPGQDPGGQPPGGEDPFGGAMDDPDMPRPSRARARSARRKARLPEKGASRKKAEPKAKGAAGPARPGSLSFSQDIAPILVANCVGCHSKDGQGVRRGNLDLSTFEGLQKGTGKPDHPVLVAGKPEESHLVQRIKGDEEPRMPQGNNRALSEEAIGKITRWVKEGGRLDAGIAPKDPMESYAATPEQLRRKELTQMPAQQRDQKVIEAGQARWKQSGSKQKPEVVTGAHFVLFGTLPNDRATSTVRAMEGPYNHLRRMLGAPAMDWPEKVSLFVFGSNNEFIEFVRTVETREVDAQEPRFSVRLDVPRPYIAAVDPGGAKKEETSRRQAKAKKAEESKAAASGSDRSLLGLLTEGLGSGSLGAAGNAPRWLKDGIGLNLARAAEPRSPYYRHLRATAFQLVDQGWPTRARQAMGGELPGEEQRAVGFALIECMSNSDFAENFPAFLRVMLEKGQGALYDQLKAVYNVTPEEFFNLTGEWVASSYGRVQ